METIRNGSPRSAVVVSWQDVLITAGYSLAPYGADGDFGSTTEQATKAWQEKHGLKPTGVVDDATWDAVKGSVCAETVNTNPTFPPLSEAARAQLFGMFKYESAPMPGNPEAINILDDWPQKNIVQVKLPGSEKLIGGPPRGTVAFHVKAAQQLQDLWQAWIDAGLLDRVLSWGGSWAPRFIRGSRTKLSNHAFASAFDINVPWNQLGAKPAAAGTKGSVAELVPLAQQYGFFWGGNFSPRQDGMHFEVAKLL